MEDETLESVVDQRLWGGLRPDHVFQLNRESSEGVEGLFIVIGGRHDVFSLRRGKLQLVGIGADEGRAEARKVKLGLGLYVMVFEIILKDIWALRCYYIT